MPGDLVELSVYGRARNYNKRISQEDQVGLVLRQRWSYLDMYEVKWTPSNTIVYNHYRRELRYASVRKRE
jgi:hypothetical protein